MRSATGANSTVTPLRVPRKLLHEIAEQAVAEAPNEACGYLHGVSDRVTGRIPMTNVDRSPDHYMLDPREQFAALKQVRDQGEELLGVYHSHPASAAWMSEEDIHLAHDPGMRYLIFSIPENTMRSFRVSKNENQKKFVTEQNIVWIES